MSRVDDLERRVEALERRAVVADPTVDAESALWALDALQRRTDDAGAVMLVGSVGLPTGERAEWQYGALLGDLLDGGWDDVAPVLAALGHPVRLQLLRAVLNGTRTTAALAESDVLGTSGQLHHHLRQLVSTGWLRTTGRGRYEVPVERVVPLLVLVTGARR